MRFKFKCLCLMLLACAVTMSGCSESKKRNVTVVQYTMNTLNIPESTGFVYRINDNGQAVGYVYGYGVIIWDENGVDTRLAEPPGCQILTMDFNSMHINLSGAVAGSGLILQDSNCKHAVILWLPDGEPQILRTTDYPDTCNFMAYGVTDSGKVVFLQQCASNGAYSIITYNPDGTFTDGTPDGGLDTFYATNPNCNDYGLVVGQKTFEGKTRAVVIDTSQNTIHVLPMLPESNDKMTTATQPPQITRGLLLGAAPLTRKYNGLYGTF